MPLEGWVTRTFDDQDPAHFGTGWISGTASVFFSLLGLGGALCLHFPQLLTLPDARPVYPIPIIRLLIQGVIVLGIVLGAIASVKVLIWRMERAALDRGI